MENPKRYLITSALPYANGPKHIGHLAGAYLPADIYVRYLRAQKKDVVYVCGSDEHGAAITIQAMKEKTTPKAIVDKINRDLQTVIDMPDMREKEISLGYRFIGGPPEKLAEYLSQQIAKWEKLAKTGSLLAK